MKTIIKWIAMWGIKVGLMPWALMTIYNTIAWEFNLPQFNFWIFFLIEALLGMRGIVANLSVSIDND